MFSQAKGYLQPWQVCSFGQDERGSAYSAGSVDNGTINEPDAKSSGLKCVHVSRSDAMLTDSYTPLAGGHSGAYSAFEHLVSTLLLPPKSLMLIVTHSPLALYCDRSEVLDGQLTIVAGGVASIEEWKQLDSKWASVLAEEHLEYFHMKEFAPSVGQFAKGWKKNEQRRRKLIQQLTTIIQEYVPYWIAMCVAETDYEQADRIYELREYAQPYPLCGLACINAAHEWRDAQHLDYLPMEYVFEEGDPHQGQLRDRVREQYGKEPLFRPKTTQKARKPLRANAGPVVPLIPLQVADFVAYEVGKLTRTLRKDKFDIYEQYRASFLRIRGIPHRWKPLSGHAIRTDLNLLGVRKRIDSLRGKLVLGDR